MKESFAAFSQGAKAVNPRVSVLTSYVGNWDDVSAGREQALFEVRLQVLWHQVRSAPSRATQRLHDPDQL